MFKLTLNTFAIVGLVILASACSTDTQQATVVLEKTEEPFHENRPVPEAAIEPDVADAVYASYHGADIALDIYLPNNKMKPKALIAYFFGGGWQSGSKKTIKNYVLSQLDRGYAIAAIDYSLSDKATWPVQGQQAKAAIRWLRANAYSIGLPADKIIAMGNSAGGHIAAFLAMGGSTGEEELIQSSNKDVSEKVQGLVAWYGAFDFLLNSPSADDFSPESAPTKLLGCGTAPQKCIKKAFSTSSINFVTANAPPVYLLHGTADSVVPFQQSVNFADKLKTYGVPVSLELFDDFKHGDPGFEQAERRVNFENFIDKLVAEL